MKLLALEFSTPRRSVAIACDGIVRGHGAEQGGRETHAFALIEAALRDANVSREQIDCIAVGTGPGSYAGIRIAIAIAQGWHLARGVKLIGIPSADAVAAQMHAAGARGVVHAIVDAQRGEFFEALYELDDTEWRNSKPFALTSPSADRSSPGHLFVRCDILEHATEQVLLPDAATIASLASAKTGFVAASALEPIYLRKAEFVKLANPPSRS
jgi:tRNA threonylcarbamoyladenosine biosynthesis protein TsaB